MDTKWKNTTDTKTSGTGTVPSPKKGHPFRAVAGLLAFLLSLLLLTDTLLYFGSRLSTSSGRKQLLDAFQSDYQTTYSFRQEIAADLNVLMAMGTDERLDFVGYGGDTPKEQAKKIHEYWKADQNLLYAVSSNGKTAYCNHSGISDKTTPNTLPEGYNFLLQFDGSKVRIWKDGQELEIYQDTYYDFDNWGQWYVPGYQNIPTHPALAHVHVTMAAIQEPKVFVGNGNFQYRWQQNNPLYYLQQELSSYHIQFYIHIALLAAALVLLVISGFLHKDKVRADRALAKVTGKLWFEAKLLLLLLPLMLFDVSPSATQATSVELSTVSTDTAVFEATISQEQGGEDLTYIVDPISPQARLVELPLYLAEHSGMCMVLVLLWYVFAINDWRYQKRPWLHGICGMLAARQLQWPIQKRMSRTAGWLGVAFLVLVVELGMLFFTLRLFSLIWYGLLLLPCVIAAAVFVWALIRQNTIWKDLGTLSSQIAAVRSGDLDHPISLPDHHDLYQTMEDLNHIQQGIHQAVEERTQSERMKVELVTNVSHDLKTPLTSIISYTELLEQEQLDPPAGEYVAILGEKAQRLKAMVQDVFEVSKAASGQLPVQLERLDLVRLLRQTLADQDEAIQSSGLLFRLSIPDEPIYIMADSDRMYRVFQNLLSNALRYSLDHSRVYLTVEQQDGEVIAILQNTSAMELNPCTDYLGRFVRGDESRTDGGSGLGLSIAASFTQVCGGTLKIQTQADLFTAKISFPIDS